MLAKKTYKNQITIPQAIAKQFDGIEYFDVHKDGETIVLKPINVEMGQQAIEVIRDKIKKLGITEMDLKDAIRDVRQGS